MRAKAKAALVYLLVSLAMPSARAQEPGDRCDYLAAVNADMLHTALTKYTGEVLGKHPEHWTAQDYVNLAANARACHGLPANVQDKVDAEDWANKLQDAYKQNAETNARSLAIAAAYAGYWKGPGEFPACASFLKWKRDDTWYVNNSGEIFGKPFEDMTKEELGFYKRLAEECVPVMESILGRWRVHSSRAEEISRSVLESIEMDAKAALEDELPSSLSVFHEGKRVPVAYLRPTTQKIVKKIALLEAEDRVMPTNSLIQISKWAEQVETEGRPGPDLLYAREIKNIVADHLFRAARQLGDPSLSAGP